jgi:inosine-uridine nucleoside N-ribohydrolase
MTQHLKLVAFLSLWLVSAAGTSLAKGKEAKKAGLDMAAVRTVVKANMLKVQQCYTDLIIENMATRGKIIVTWDIDDKGVAQNVAVKDGKPEQQALGGCVTEKITSWSFPPAEPEKTFPVTYTFNFGN